MRHPISEKQISAILALPAPIRYEHFIKRVCAWNEIWGIYDDGYVVVRTDDGRESVPFWPAEEYANLFAQGEYANFKPRAIPIDTFMEVMLPTFKKEGTHVAIFPLPNGKGMVVDVDMLMHDLELEKSKAPI